MESLKDPDRKKLATEERKDLAQPAKLGRGQKTIIDRSDLIVPRAMLLQYTKPQSIETTHRPGEIINSLTGDLLPAEFVPIFYFFNWIRFNPRNETDPNYDPAFDLGAVIWQSKDPEDMKVIEESKWGKNGEPPLATKFINFFSYFVGEDMPVVISFAKTSYKQGKKLLTLTQFPAGVDIFSKQYSLTSKEDKNDKGEYYILQVAPKGKADEKSFTIAERWYESYRERAIEVHAQEQEIVGEE